MEKEEVKRLSHVGFSTLLHFCTPHSSTSTSDNSISGWAEKGLLFTRNDKEGPLTNPHHPTFVWWHNNIYYSMEKRVRKSHPLTSITQEEVETKRQAGRLVSCVVRLLCGWYNSNRPCHHRCRRKGRITSLPLSHLQYFLFDLTKFSRKTFDLFWNLESVWNFYCMSNMMNWFMRIANFWSIHVMLRMRQQEGIDHYYVCLLGKKRKVSKLPRRRIINFTSNLKASIYICT